MSKLIVIDDENSVCELLSRLFTDAGYEVITSSDPLKGFELVSSERPDCIILDIKMPKIGGVEILQKIMELEDPPQVIMVTAYGNLESAMESMKLGAYDYIAKPFNLDFIKTVVAKCIEEKKNPK